MGSHGSYCCYIWTEKSKKNERRKHQEEQNFESYVVGSRSVPRRQNSIQHKDGGGKKMKVLTRFLFSSWLNPLAPWQSTGDPFSPLSSSCLKKETSSKYFRKTYCLFVKKKKNSGIISIVFILTELDLNILLPNLQILQFIPVLSILFLKCGQKLYN